MLSEKLRTQHSVLTTWWPTSSSRTALAGFRKWLQSRYPSLEALNAQWETQFKTWDEVKPFTTDQIKNRMGSGDALPRGNPDWQAVQKLNIPEVPRVS